MLLCEGSSGAAYHDLFVYQLEKESVKLTEKYHLYTSLPEENAGIILMESVDGADAEIKNQSEDASDYEIWDTFDKRNIHFYINRCGFHAVEFYNRFHPDTHFPEDAEDDRFDGMFRFQKKMK